MRRGETIANPTTTVPLYSSTRLLVQSHGVSVHRTPCPLPTSAGLRLLLLL